MTARCECGEWDKVYGSGCVICRPDVLESLDDMLAGELPIELRELMDGTEEE